MISGRSKHMIQTFRVAFRLLLLGSLWTAAAPVLVCQASPPQIPQLDGAWWQVAGNPDLGDLTGPFQQPVDFAIWQAADGTWQIWSCVRGTNCGGATRLFYRWQGNRITDANWKPMGIAMQANPALREVPGGLQAPHVFLANGRFYMVYGDWWRICLQTSTDGKTFQRVLNSHGEPDLFTGPYDGTRDPMMLRIGNLWHCYYMGSRLGAQYESATFCRTSHDLVHWSEPMTVSAGGIVPATPADAVPARSRAERMVLLVQEPVLRTERAEHAIRVTQSAEFWCR